jgi:hypothetical protein
MKSQAMRFRYVAFLKAVTPGENGVCYEWLTPDVGWQICEERLRTYD